MNCSATTTKIASKHPSTPQYSRARAVLCSPMTRSTLVKLCGQCAASIAIAPYPGTSLTAPGSSRLILVIKTKSNAPFSSSCSRVPVMQPRFFSEQSHRPWSKKSKRKPKYNLDQTVPNTVKKSNVANIHLSIVLSRLQLQYWALRKMKLQLLQSYLSLLVCEWTGCSFGKSAMVTATCYQVTGKACARAWRP